MNFSDILYVHIPKTAGTSMTFFFRERQCGYKEIYENFEQFDNKGFVTFGHTSIMSLLENNIMTQDYFGRAYKFSFVRNPFDYFVALFTKGITMNFDYTHKWLLTSNCLELFERFCLSAKNRIHPIGLYNSRENNQVNKQTTWIKDKAGKIFVDFVGRFESLDEDFKRLCKIIGIKYTPLPIAQTSINTKQRLKDEYKYRKFYNSDTRKIVEDLYKDDLETFNYTF